MTSTLSAMTGDFLNKILPTYKEGYLIVAVGHGPRLDANGKYGHTRWEERPFLWPDMALTAVEFIQNHAMVGDVYTCPYLMKTPKREKGNAAWRALIHSDVDTLIDPCVVHDLGSDAFIVWSGSLGHGHVYVPLAYPVMPVQHEMLCRGLATHLGGDKAKVSENDLLRPPGTFNHKSAVNGGLMTAVWSN